MLGVALSATVIAARPGEAERYLAALRTLRVPHVSIEPSGTPLEEIALALQLPAQAIHYVDDDEGRLHAARDFGMQPASTLSDAFDMLVQAYTRSALDLRHMFRSVLEWRPGHFKS